MNIIRIFLMSVMMLAGCLASGETLDLPAHKPSWIPIMGDIIFFIPAFKKDDSTLEGIDSDGSGIRDDVQAAIDQRYANDNFSRKHSLLIAKTQQAMLTGSDSNLSIHDAVGYIDMLDQCLERYSLDPLAGVDFVQPLQLNTYARSKNYIDAVYQAHVLNGHFPKVALSCSF